MINASLDEPGHTGHIVLAPNLSLSWRTNKYIFLLIVAVTSLVAGYYISRGGWLVLPFSILELIVIGVSTWMFFSRNNQCEVITFTDTKVVIERGRKKMEKSWEYPRHWSQIHVREHGLYNIPVVSIRSHGKELELGSFLGYDEKIQFIRLLKNITRAFQLSQQHLPQA